MTPEKTRGLLAAYASRGDLQPELALGCFRSEEHVSTGEVHKHLAGPEQLRGLPEWSSLDFYRRQKKVILRNCGSIDPMNMNETVACGTYRGAVRAMCQMSPDEVIDEVLQSGLRGRGGAAFPTAQKWRLARQAVADVKYVVCNADEGEPGAYMDRTVLEGDPHAVLEGMFIGAYAVGAREGFIYVRSEYPLAIEILQHAIDQAEQRGLLGDDIFGSGWSFHVTVRRGAGAYICGEETALIESLEGHSGEPRTRPPYPVTSGLWGKPTVVNNVKTWASVAPILTRGAAWYAGMGTRRTPGTTIFSLEGAVKNAGLVEVPFGISLRELIYEIGGGIQGDRPLKALQAGGAARGCIPPSMLDLRIDTEDRDGETIMIGTGGIIALDPERLHGRHGPLPRRLLPGRVVRQVRSLPGGDQADVPYLERRLRRPCRRSGLGRPGAAGKDHPLGCGVRDGQHGAQRGVDHAGPFPRGIREPPPRQAVCGRRVSRSGGRLQEGRGPGVSDHKEKD